MKFIIGLIGIAAGFLLIWKSNWIVQNFGRIDWAEEHIATEGGTRLLWKLIGLAIIFISMLYMFGMVEGIIIGIFGSLFRR
ncbi:hypothetical protein KJ840_00455 [Patescibacteria group bacterium]|nr:hypothetical protein [Patescibacteria group bacterium]